MSLKALWNPIALDEKTPNLARSSHGLAQVGNELILFGGELKPRTPVDGDVLVVKSLATSPEISTLSCSNDGSNPWPASRVGASFVSASNGKVYMWGGRGGTEMGTFTSERGIWEFDPQTRKWEELETRGDQPEPRSFHTMCAHENKLYLHAGCPASGRLTQLHSLDLDTLEWTQLEDAPAPGRGGTVLTSLPPSSSGRPSLLARFGGFAGHELDGLDVFDVEKKEWRAVEVEGESPEKRSVHVFVGLGDELEHEGKSVVAVLALGEREGAPAELGHNGAGCFHDDAWALLATREAQPKFTWARLESSSRSEGAPKARGWLPAARVAGAKVVFQGGLNEKNERLGDAWSLEVVVE
ncbi:hypothetical protein JCM16303_002963 [Sporobolomyces ruberrimus]